MESNYKKVYLSATIYALITGLSFIFVKIALESSDPFDLLAFRFSTAFLAVLVSYLFKWFKFNYNKERIMRIIPIALLYPLSFFVFQTFGLKYSSSAEGGIFLSVSPIFTLILATYFLKEKTTTLQKLSIIFSVIGVIFITISNSDNFDFNSIKGTIFLILSALSLSGYSVMARKLTKDFTSIELSSMMIIISFISYNTISIGKHLYNGTLSDFFLPLTNFSFVIAILYLGVLSSLGTSLMTNYILSKIDASKMSVFSNLSTVITIIAGTVFLKEKVFTYHIIGSVFIIGGVLGANFLDKDFKEN